MRKWTAAGGCATWGSATPRCAIATPARRCQRCHTYGAGTLYRYQGASGELAARLGANARRVERVLPGPPGIDLGQQPTCRSRRWGALRWKASP